MRREVSVCAEYHRWGMLTVSELDVEARVKERARPGKQLRCLGEQDLQATRDSHLQRREMRN